MERIRESMAKELVNLSNKLELLQEQSKEYPQLKDNYEVNPKIYFLIILDKKGLFLKLNFLS